MSGNRRHAGGTASSMYNLVKAERDAAIEHVKALVACADDYLGGNTAGDRLGFAVMDARRFLSRNGLVPGVKP